MSLPAGQVAFAEGPYLQVAAICEKVLSEQDGVLSLIRVVDRVIQPMSLQPTADQMPPLPVNLVAVVMLKAGAARGRHRVTIRPEAPSGFTMPEVGLPVLFEGDPDRGVNVVLNLAFVLDQEGLYWFDVLLEDRLLTRMPLRVVWQPITTGAGPAQP